jgi:hypothetical protein
LYQPEKKQCRFFYRLIRHGHFSFLLNNQRQDDGLNVTVFVREDNRRTADGCPDLIDAFRPNVDLFAFLPSKFPLTQSLIAADIRRKMAENPVV